MVAKTNLEHHVVVGERECAAGRRRAHIKDN